LPLVKKYGAAVVAISNDETGISEDPDVRFEVAKKIVHRAMDHGIPASDVVVDPLVMPIGAINQAGVQVMRLVHRLKKELKVNSTWRRIQRQFRTACARRHQQRVPDYWPSPRVSLPPSRIRCNGDIVKACMAARRHDGSRSRLRALDSPLPRSDASEHDGSSCSAGRSARPAAKAVTAVAPPGRSKGYNL
jgi:hypothetical protein